MGQDAKLILNIFLNICLPLLAHGTMSESWDAQLQEYLVKADLNLCTAAALAAEGDCVMYAAAGNDGENGWKTIWADPHSQEIVQDDGETKKSMTINETECLKGVLAEDRDKLKSIGGVWFGGQKFTFTQSKEEEQGENTYKWRFCAGQKKGVHIVSTGGQVVVGYYEEEKGQTSGNCKKGVMDFAVYLKETCGL